MKVTLTSHGGLAAGMRRPPCVVESSALPERAAADLARLVAAARTAPAVREQDPGRARDAMSYTITVEENGEATVLRQSDAALAPAFADLVAWLKQHGARG